jgi:hypothetical protein
MGEGFGTVLKFTIPGHPVGYMRTTQAGCKFDKSYKRYQQYKDEVVAAFIDQCEGNYGSPKPLTTIKSAKTSMIISIYFKNEVHCDPDNCFKAVADALFKCDKYLSGSFTFDYDKLNPRVEVIIA